MTFECAHCGCEVVRCASHVKSRVFCTKTCSDLARKVRADQFCASCGKVMVYSRRKGGDRTCLECRRATHATRPCAQCGQAFTTVAGLAHRRYCKRDCYLAAHRKPCVICGAVVQARGSRQFTCGRSCGARLNYFSRYGHWPLTKVAIEACPTCGTAFVKRYHRRFCSVECQTSRVTRGVITKDCPVCGTIFVHDGRGKGAGFRQSTCSMECHKKRSRSNQLASKHARRAREKGLEACTVRREVIFARDKWCCKLCGKKTRRNVPGRHPLAPTLDHIIPITLGGDHNPANLQCAHFRCNLAKGNRLKEPVQLALIG